VLSAYEYRSVVMFLTCALLMQSTGSESLPTVLPSTTAGTETASVDKTPVVQNHVKQLSDSGTDDTLALDTSSKDLAAENKTQSAKKKGKGWSLSSTFQDLTN